MTSDVLWSTGPGVAAMAQTPGRWACGGSPAGNFQVLRHSRTGIVVPPRDKPTVGAGSPVSGLGAFMA